MTEESTTTAQQSRLINNDIHNNNQNGVFSMTHHGLVPSVLLVDMNGWFIYISNRLIQPPEAYEQLLIPATRLGSKSTASLFLLAYRHALSTADHTLLERLMQKMASTTVTAQLEFSRKLAFRLLSNERPDKLIVLISAMIQYPLLFAPSNTASNPTPPQQQQQHPIPAINGLMGGLTANASVESMGTSSSASLVSSISSNNQATAHNGESYNYNDNPFKSTLLAMLSLRQVLLVTVDVRAILNKNETYRPLFVWMFAIVHDVLEYEKFRFSSRPEFDEDELELTDHTLINSNPDEHHPQPHSPIANRQQFRNNVDNDDEDGDEQEEQGENGDGESDDRENMQVDQQMNTTANAFNNNTQTCISLLETISKALCDLFLVINPEEVPSIISYGLIPATISLAACSHPSVLDHTYRYLSYLYEFCNPGNSTNDGDHAVSENRQNMASETIRILDESNIFDTLLRNLVFTSDRIDIVLTTLQHFATHLVPRIPKRLRNAYMETFYQLRSAEDQSVQNHALRCMHVMGSIGIRVGITVLYRENIESRRAKQIWMHRQCEGCQKRETVFGEFMMCAGCRKVRYCSKDCQVRDWKYHRMSCQFFRPRPGYRSRGTSTPVDAITQTEESSFPSAIQKDEVEDDDNTPPKNIQHHNSHGNQSHRHHHGHEHGSSSRSQQRMATSNSAQGISSSAVSNTTNNDDNNMDVDNVAQNANSQTQRLSRPLLNSMVQSRASSASDLMNSTRQSMENLRRTSDAQTSTDLTFRSDIRAWRRAEYNSRGTQTIE